MKRKKSLVVIGFVGTVLDGGGDLRTARRKRRWSRWRPSVDLTLQPGLPVARLDLLHNEGHGDFAELVAADIAAVSPATQVRLHALPMVDPWDFEGVYAALYDYFRAYPFRPDDEDYLLHITTGTHVVQICLFLLAESRHAPANLLQTSPRHPSRPVSDDDDELLPRTSPRGTATIIDLDLSRYDKLRGRFSRERADSVATLKQHVETRDPRYNALMSELAKVASSSTAPLLLLGPTGTGKTQLARRIYELKRQRHQVEGPLVEVNCATLRGDGAMSALFGHRRGSFTGAISDRPGLLKHADGGMLFLDEIGELGLDEQAMLLRALEEKRFLPLGADREASSSFQFVCGTHRDLRARVADNVFREDLLARIDIWSFALPPLRERRADIAPNVEVELARASEARGTQISMSREARTAFLAFADEHAWPGNFRELAASIERMATLCDNDRIDLAVVKQEIARKRRDAGDAAVTGTSRTLLDAVLGDAAHALDSFDAVQLEHVLKVCRASRSLADAGRKLFDVSRTRRASVNDSDRIRKYLASHGLAWDDVSS